MGSAIGCELGPHADRRHNDMEGEALSLWIPVVMRPSELRTGIPPARWGIPSPSILPAACAAHRSDCRKLCSGPRQAQRQRDD